MQQAYSPFDPSKEALVLKKISAAELTKAYTNLYEVNVSAYFSGLTEIALCKCPLTGLLFYTPATCAGDERFYQQMSEKPWYYHPERWEHRRVAEHIEGNCKVLEIGAGEGAFFNLLTKKPGLNYLGLEFNPEAIKNAEKKGIQLLQQSITEHANNNRNCYDVVCSFQVMEHVPDLKSMIDHSLLALKKGGRLIMAVPNNSVAFINVFSNIHPSKYLNMPPHHMNLFDENSLSALSRCFPLKLQQVICEPLQDLHVDVYLYNQLGKLLFKQPRITNLIWKSGLPQLWRPMVKRKQSQLKGHTLIAVFEKL